MKNLAKNCLLIICSMALCHIILAAETKKFVDLTHEFSKDTLHWPTATPFKLKKIFAGTAPRGYFYAVNDFTTCEHVGTHVDAPIHFAKGQENVAEIPLDHLIGNGVMVDVSNKTLKNPDYEVSVEDFVSWEHSHKKIPARSILLIRTGFENYWLDAKKYLGTDQFNGRGLNLMHFPGLSTAAAEWLIKERKIKAIGIDTVSIDFGQSKDFLTHQILGKNNIPFFENVTNLKQLATRNFTVYALPMKIAEGTGAPLRIIAVTK